MGTGGALVEPRVDRGSVLDLAGHLDRAVGDRGRNRRAADLRRRHRLDRARDRRVLDQIPLRRRRDRADVSRRRGARSGVFKLKWKEAVAVGLASFFFPFLGCAAGAHYVLGWEVMPSWLAGVAMSTTSVAVVYAVMLEFGFNVTDYGKTVLAACFVTDLGTVVALGLIFAPFTMKTVIFVGVGIAAFVVLPWLTPRFFRRYGNRPSELEAKYLLLCLLGLGALATWADSEAVLPAYVIGMVLAGTVGKDHALIRRLRTLTFGLLTPFYFIRAGSFVSVPELVAAPAAFVFMLVVKVFSKIVGVYPVTKVYKAPNKE